MHGVVNRAIECFLRDTYTSAVWDEIAVDARIPMPSFEAMLAYDPPVTERVLSAAVLRIGKPRDALLEDLGIYLVSHPRYEALRRLLRFAGVTFEDFLLSVDELPGRARLALPDLEVVPIRLQQLGPRRYEDVLRPRLAGLRARPRRRPSRDGRRLRRARHHVAPVETEDGQSCLELTLHTAHHSRGRTFELSARRA
jgi:hypothetical protein